MYQYVTDFLRTKFSNPEAAGLLVVSILSALGILLLGKILAPILAGLVIAFLCEPAVLALQRYVKFPRMLSVVVIFVVFIGVMVVAFGGLFPMLGRQLSEVVSEFPQMLQGFHHFLGNLHQRYPQYVHENMIQGLVSSTSFSPEKYGSIGKAVLSYSAHSITGIMTTLVYIFLVPLSVLFFLKDKYRMLGWMKSYLPSRRGLVNKVGCEMKVQLGKYVRGKFIELIIVGVGSYIVFWIFNLNYAVLLATLVGLSVIIPYVGMVLVTIPIVLVGLVQFGLSGHFWYLMLTYGVWQALDGNVLVPILFSEAVNLHPIAIIVAVLVFGSIWGFWGLFFAIPLATLVKTLINAWSKAG